MVPQFEVRKLYSIWQPILNAIETKTGLKIKFSASTNIQNFEAELELEKFDFAYMNPYHMLLASQNGYEPLVRDTNKMLHGILVVRKDSNIKSLDDLDGKVVAFPSPNALGASLQMRQETHDKFGIQIKARFVKTHDSVYLNVILREAAAGGGVQKTLYKQKDAYKDQLRIIHKTTPVSPHPIAANKNLPSHIKSAVMKTLLNMGQSTEGNKLLERIPINAIGLADMEDYLPLKSMGLERFYVKPELK